MVSISLCPTTGIAIENTMNNNVTTCFIAYNKMCSPATSRTIKTRSVELQCTPSRIGPEKTLENRYDIAAHANA